LRERERERGKEEEEEEEEVDVPPCGAEEGEHVNEGELYGENERNDRQDGYHRVSVGSYIKQR
jgi:hypothetical protein